MLVVPYLQLQSLHICASCQAFLGAESIFITPALSSALNMQCIERTLFSILVPAPEVTLWFHPFTGPSGITEVNLKSDVARSLASLPLFTSYPS
jgi:hypothetical protein